MTGSKTIDSPTSAFETVNELRKKQKECVELKDSEPSPFVLIVLGSMLCKCYLKIS